MANSESIRNLLIGREAVAGVLAATVKHMPFLQASHSPKKQIIIPKEYRGVRVFDAVAMEGKQHSEIKCKILGYYDLAGWFLATALNAPADTANDTNAVDHTFKVGAVSPPTNSLEYSYGVGTAAEIWEKALGAVVNQADFTFAADKLVEMDFTWLSALVSVIGAPSIPGFSIASYVHPFNPPTLSVNIGGTYNALLSAKVSVKNGRTPLFTTQTAKDPLRFIEGPIEVDFDFEADYTAESGSFYANYKANVSPGAVTLQAKDTTNLIGLTVANPTFALTIPKPYFTSVELKPDGKGNTIMSAKGKGLYDSATSSALTIVLTNIIANYNGS